MFTVNLKAEFATAENAAEYYWRITQTIENYRECSGIRGCENCVEDGTDVAGSGMVTYGHDVIGMAFANIKDES